MSWVTKILVLSNQTVSSDTLRDRMRERAAAGPTEFTILLPRGRDGVTPDAQRALDRFAAAGLDAELAIGDRDPLIAIRNAWDPGRFDEVIVATLPAQSSRWLAVDLPYRVQQLTGALVTHVVAQRPRAGPGAIRTAA